MLNNKNAGIWFRIAAKPSLPAESWKVYSFREGSGVTLGPSLQTTTGFPVYVAGDGVGWWWELSTLELYSVRGIALQGALLTSGFFATALKTGLLRFKLT